jgi:hypothetical protein
MRVHCCGCSNEVDARLTDGREAYPHRPDLGELPFWRCDACGNFVGCHHKTRNRTQPLGCIPSPEIKNARRHIHRLLDPLWQSGRHQRAALYQRLAEATGKAEYHTAEIRTLEEARLVYRALRRLT